MARLAEGNVVTIHQRDGTVAKFPEVALRDAYINLMARLRAADGGGEIPPEHPLLEAVRNSPDPRWSRSLYAADGVGVRHDGEHVEDLSE